MCIIFIRPLVDEIITVSELILEKEKEKEKTNQEQPSFFQKYVIYFNFIILFNTLKVVYFAPFIYYDNN